jgi:glycosyltransferase involved in cell wall biosynthesis
VALTVLQVAYPFAPVGRDSVGGAEQILAACDEAVVSAGYGSVVIACEGSQVKGKLISVPAMSRADDAASRAEAHANHKRAIEAAISRFGIDLVHCHGIDFDHYLPEQGTNVLVTLHLDPAAYDRNALSLKRPGTFFNCVSRSQNARCPTIRNLLPPIENGVDLARLRPEPEVQRTHALVLARTCPEKGIHLAIEAAKRADADLVIAGEIFPYADHERYFTEQIKPRLDDRRMFAGPASFETKRKLLQSARCLLIPSLIDETSSLAAMEALACGTPVIAFRRGALPEIIENGVTGALVGNVDDMAAAIGHAASYEPAACVSAARRRFSAARMQRAYISVYERLGAQKPIMQHVQRAAS